MTLPPRFFNTAGPVRPDLHYILPPLSRWDQEGIFALIRQQKYFVLHAPRQTGKTSCLFALMQHLNQSGEYCCLYVNVEMAQSAREDVRRGIKTILSEIGSRARTFLEDSFLEEIWPEILTQQGEDAAINQTLTRWAEYSDRPVILLLDEIDSLVGDTLISVLRQLRAGYDKRPSEFPQSIILCGVRDVRDYRIHSDQQKAVITGGSAFNIKAESLRLGNFTREEVRQLYQLHTEETGQAFTPEALQAVWEFTHGQPWLVNALGYEACFKKEGERERTRPITAELLEQAKERLVLRRETHLDQLVDKLQEPRVRRVVKPMLEGVNFDQSVRQDDIEYVHDLGLIRRDSSGVQIANAIYREIIPRELSVIFQLNFESNYQPAWYLAPDGRLDMHKLLSAFQQFFRENAEHWLERFDYKEAGPQLLMQAFLQRIVNGGGQVGREYGLGRKRTDLLVIWPYPQGTQRTVIELKILYGSLERTIREGLEQTWEYMDRSGTGDAHLVIFDRDEKRSWEDKIFQREESYQGHVIQVWGM